MGTLREIEIWRPGVKMQGDHQTQPFIIAAVRIDEMLGTDVLGYLGPERAVWQPRTRRRCRSRCKVAAAPCGGSDRDHPASWARGCPCGRTWRACSPRASSPRAAPPSGCRGRRRSKRIVRWAPLNELILTKLGVPIGTDKKAEWLGYDGVGGGLGTTIKLAAADPKTPVLLVLRTIE